MKNKFESEFWKVADSLRSAGAISRLQLAKKLREIDLPLSPSAVAMLISTLPHGRVNFVPQFFTDAVRELVKDKSARLVCDPWAGFGAIVAAIDETISPDLALAFTRSADDAAVGQATADRVQW